LPVARFQKKVCHFLLGDGIADLNRRSGRDLTQLLRRKGRAVNAVFANAATDHDHAIASMGLLEVRRFAANLGRHQAACAAENQGLA
jgi:hypothetical protein